MKKVVIIIVIAILAIAAGAFMLTRDTENNNAAETATTVTTDSSGAVITYTDSGFSPSSSTVSSGTTITIKNDSTKSLQFASSDHPTHTKNPELNGATIEPGQTQTITVTKKGTNGYHNHLNASDTGTIIVQ